MTYGITNTHQGRRDFIAPPVGRLVGKQAQRLWQDLIDPRDFRIDVATPQPRLLVLRKYMVLLVSSVSKCPPGMKPVLTVWSSTGLTTHFLHSCTFEDHLSDLPYGRLCVPLGLRSCDLMIGGNVVPRTGLALFPTRSPGKTQHSVSA